MTRKPARPSEAPIALPEPLEYTEQVAVFQFVDHAIGEFPKLWALNASLNGVRLPIGVARKMKAAGMKEGYPDLFLPVVRFGGPLGIWAGCYIELKRLTKGRVDPAQKDWHAFLRDEGYQVHVARGRDAACEILLRYLGATDAQVERLVYGRLVVDEAA